MIFPQLLISRVLGSDPGGWGPSQGLCRPPRVHTRSLTKVRRDQGSILFPTWRVAAAPGLRLEVRPVGRGGAGAPEGGARPKAASHQARTPLLTVLGGVEKTGLVGFHTSRLFLFQELKIDERRSCHVSCGRPVSLFAGVSSISSFLESSLYVQRWSRCLGCGRWQKAQQAGDGAGPLGPVSVPLLVCSDPKDFGRWGILALYDPWADTEVSWLDPHDHEAPWSMGTAPGGWDSPPAAHCAPVCTYRGAGSLEAALPNGHLRHRAGPPFGRRGRTAALLPAPCRGRFCPRPPASEVLADVTQAKA